MQGYILHLQKARNEDMIVKILTSCHIKTLYRFYGMRHSILNLGRKIDFEEEAHLHFLPKLHHIMHLAHKWENDYQRYYAWQHIIKLLHRHLIDVYEIEEFYFNLLESAAHKLYFQNPKRVLLESYAHLLAFEGRIHHQHLCFVCEGALGEQISLGRAFIFAHHHCIGGKIFNKNDILQFLHTQSTIELNDDTINALWEILSMGL